MPRHEPDAQHFYKRSVGEIDGTALVERKAALCDEMLRYGYRRVGAQRRIDGFVVNKKRVQR